VGRSTFSDSRLLCKGLQMMMKKEKMMTTPRSIDSFISQGKAIHLSTEV
jgi:hypothetical protein